MAAVVTWLISAGLLKKAPGDNKRLVKQLPSHVQVKPLSMKAVPLRAAPGLHRRPGSSGRQPPALPGRARVGPAAVGLLPFSITGL